MNKTKIKVVISEHDTDDQFIFRKAIQEIGKEIEVQFVPNYAQLKDLLSKAEFLPDLILADVMSPFFELCAVTELSELNKAKDIPVYLFAEGYTGVCRDAAITCGAKDLYNKPSNINALKDILTSIFETVLKEVTEIESVDKV